MEIIGAGKPQRRVGGFVIAGPGAAVVRIALEHVLAAAMREGESIVGVIAGFDQGAEPPFRIGLRNIIARPAERDRQGGDRTAGPIVTAQSIAQRVPSAQRKVCGFNRQEAFRQDSVRSGEGREEHPQFLDSLARKALTHPAFDRATELFLAQSVNVDRGHSRFPGAANARKWRGMVEMGLRAAHKLTIPQARRIQAASFSTHSG